MWYYSIYEPGMNTGAILSIYFSGGQREELRLILYSMAKKVLMTLIK